MECYVNGSGLHYTPGGVALVVTLIALSAILVVASVIKTAIRARYGARQSVSQASAEVGLTATRQTELLVKDNARLQS